MFKNCSIKNIFLRGLFLSSITLGGFSCTNDDDFHKDFHYVSMPIERVEISDTIFLNEETTFIAHSKLKDNCQVYFTLDFVRIENQITITPKAIEHEDRNCGTDIDFSLRINFTPTNLSTYKFMFWTGQDPITKEEKYITKEIVVESNEALNSN